MFGVWFGALVTITELALRRLGNWYWVSAGPFGYSLRLYVCCSVSGCDSVISNRRHHFSLPVSTAHDERSCFLPAFSVVRLNSTHCTRAEHAQPPLLDPQTLLDPRRWLATRLPHQRQLDDASIHVFSSLETPPPNIAHLLFGLVSYPLPCVQNTQYWVVSRIRER